MSIVSYIIVAIAVGIVALLTFRRSAEATPVRLSAGLAIAFSIAAIHTALYLLGIAIGDLIRLQAPNGATIYDKTNAYILLGLFVAVIIKLFAPYMRRKPKLPTFGLTSATTVLMMGLATGINVLLLGIGVGFAPTFSWQVGRIIWPMLIAVFLLGYLGIMFGRQKVALRPRRWMAVVCVMLLGVAVATVVNA